MTSSYTSNLRFVQQGDGDNSNTWGDVVNAGDGLLPLPESEFWIHIISLGTYNGQQYYASQKKPGCF